jgi:hydrogenase/urease accessory protein HupE
VTLATVLRSVAAHARRSLLTVLVCFATTAQAHQFNLSTARIELHPGRMVSIEVALKGGDVDRTAGTQVYDAATDTVDAARLEAARGRVAASVLGNIDLAAADGTPCRASEPEVAPDGDGVVVRARFACGMAEGDLVYSSTVLTEIDPAARQIVLLGTGDDARQALLDATRTSVTITAPAPPLWSTLQRYLISGIEHIFLGYDHIAFLVAILLWADRVWPVVTAVTAFTIAHSITLSLAALGVFTIPSTMVETAVAASIVFVAVENFFSRDVARRWRITFPFGLIHGLGFAGALQQFGLPREAVIPALAAFNIGVEIGQVAIVLLIFPALLAIDRLAAPDGGTPARPRLLVYGLSGMIAVLAVRWLVMRVMMV